MAKEEKKKKKKVSSSGMTTKEKMLARKKALESRANGSGFVFPKDGVLRIRIKSPGEGEEIGMEIVQFYLGDKFKSVLSPETFGENCPLMEKYLELKDSSDPDDKELAKKLIPKRRYVVGGLVYADEKGKKVDYEGKDKGILIPRQVYQEIVNMYCDEDEAGDMTDPKNGYDIKITRTGKGQFDTNYSVQNCKSTEIPRELRGDVDLEGIVRSQMKDYDELEDILKQYLNEAPDDEDEDDDDEPKPKKKSKDKDKGKKDKLLKKKKKVSDI